MSKCFWSGQCTLAGMWSSSQSDEWRMLCISTMKFKSQRETWSHSYSLVFSKTSAVISYPPPPLHTPPCEGRSRCTFLSIPPTPFRTGLPSITFTAICSRIFHMALRWKTLRNRVVLGTGGNRKVLPDPNSDPDKKSFLPLSCTLSSGLQPGNKAGCGSCTFLQSVSMFSTNRLNSTFNSWRMSSEVFCTVPRLSEGIIFQRHLVCIVHVTSFIFAVLDRHKPQKCVCQ